MSYKQIKLAIGQPGYLTASMQGGVFGVSHWDTPYTVAQRFLGLDRDEPTPEQQESMEMGNHFERSIAEWEAHRLGVRIRKGNMAWINTDRPWLACHPDYTVPDLVEGKRIAMEIKFVSPYARSEWGEEGSDDIPYPYLLQSQAYFVCGVDWGRLDEVWVVRMMGNRIRHFVVKPDKEVMDLIVQKNTELYEQLKAGRIPEPSTPAEFVERHPHDDGSSLYADEALLGIIAKRQALDAQAKGIKKQIDDLDMQVRNRIADASVLVDPDGRKLATLKEQTSSRIDSKTAREVLDEKLLAVITKTTTTRVLRYATTKEN